MKGKHYPSAREIRNMVYTSQIRFCNPYFWYKLNRRKITIQEVDQALLNCEIIEVLWKCKPLRILVNGYTAQGKPLHIAFSVVKPTEDTWWLDAITVYVPDPALWETPERRKKIA